MNHRPLIVCVIAIFTGACHKYTNVPRSQIPVGATVRVRLSDEADQRIRSEVGVAARGLSNHQLQGDVLHTDQDGMLFSVVVAERQHAAFNDPRNITQRIRLNHEEMSDIRLRELDGPKTAAFAVGGATALGFLVFKMLRGEAGGSLPTTTPGPDEKIATAILLTLPLRVVGGH
jgi:hypothetical protein